MGDRYLKVPRRLGQPLAAWDHSLGDGGDCTGACPPGWLLVVAGNGTEGLPPEQLYSPRAVAADGAGDLYIADSGNCTVDEVSNVASGGTVSVFAGEAGSCGAPTPGHKRPVRSSMSLTASP